MSDKVKPLAPVRVKINWWNKTKLLFMIFISFALWVVLIVGGLHLLIYYVYCIFTKGVFDAETLKFGVLIVVGAYFCLILDKGKIYDALNVKRDLPFITIEQVDMTNKKTEKELENE